MRRPFRYATLLALLVAHIGCKSDGPTGPTQEEIDALTINTLRTEPTQEAAKGTTPLGLATPRDGWLYVPSNYNHAQKTPMVVLLHGANGSAAFWEGYKQIADGYGVVLLAIDSRYPTWDAIQTPFFGVDVNFIEDAMKFAFDRVNVDSARVSIAGFSDGASEAIGIGLANTHLFSRVLAHSPGLLLNPFARGIPKIFVSAGVNDEVIQMNTTAQNVVGGLRTKGFTVEFVVFDGGHTIPVDVRLRAFDIMVQEL